MASCHLYHRSVDYGVDIPLATARVLSCGFVLEMEPHEGIDFIELRFVRQWGLLGQVIYSFLIIPFKSTLIKLLSRLSYNVSPIKKALVVASISATLFPLALIIKLCLSFAINL
ncbi:hypothetical protein BXY64_1851 [Marinifilum flexuosum]|uniref:Uncharacterized protein n=1 Tax=Marinifilum flexuosum TaxID=1117708 RepID=A0A419XAN2_9BACT|nr:hypothetical protein BXY64_1851 [Marinifilum flexuosum]